VYETAAGSFDVISAAKAVQLVIKLNVPVAAQRAARDARVWLLTVMASPIEPPIALDNHANHLSTARNHQP